VPISSPISPLSSPFAPSRNRRRATEKSLAGAPHVCGHHCTNSLPPVNPAPPIPYPLSYFPLAPLPDLSPSSSLQEIEKTINGRSPLPPYAAPVILFASFWKQSSPPSSPSGSSRRGERRHRLLLLGTPPERRRSHLPGRLAGESRRNPRSPR
jgi:hypothetical protein